MENEANGVARSGAITRRNVLSGIAGAGAAAIIGTTLARAQESTPTVESGTGGTTDDTTTPDDGRATQYQTFLTKLAAEISLSDTTTLDTGIRDALKGIIDDELTAGDIAANAAIAAKTAIDEATAPISFHFGLGDGARNGGFGGPGMGGRGNGQFPGGNSDDMTEPDDVTSEATPTA
jgi:hypothetical protein